MRKKKIQKKKPVKYVVAWVEVHRDSAGKFYNKIGIAYSRENTEHAAIGDTIKAMTPAFGPRVYLIGDIVCSKHPQ